MLFDILMSRHCIIPDQKIVFTALILKKYTHGTLGGFEGLFWKRTLISFEGSVHKSFRSSLFSSVHWAGKTNFSCCWCFWTSSSKLVCLRNLNRVADIGMFFSSKSNGEHSLNRNPWGQCVLELRNLWILSLDFRIVCVD